MIYNNNYTICARSVLIYNVYSLVLQRHGRLLCYVIYIYIYRLHIGYRRNGVRHRCAVLMSFQLGLRTPQWSAKQKLYSRCLEHGQKTFVVLIHVYVLRIVYRYKHGAITAVSIQPCRILHFLFSRHGDIPVKYVERIMSDCKYNYLHNSIRQQITTNNTAVVFFIFI